MSDEQQEVQGEQNPQEAPQATAAVAKMGWSAVQVYALAIICLIVGIGSGYLFRGSAGTGAASGISQQQAAAPAAQLGSGMQGGMPGGMPGGAAPTPEQLKQMAAKQMAPLLEQLKANPNDYDLLMKIGGLYFAAQQFDETTKYYEQAAKVKPSAEVYTRLSSAYYYGGASDKAIAALNLALQKDPKYANALYNLGMLKWQVQGDTKGAIECWQKLLKTNPNHPQRDQVEKMIKVVNQHKDMPASK
jgi:cytochrome c-type biogenesis protein CcmH/NrfG